MVGIPVKFTDLLDPSHFHCIRYIGPPPPQSSYDKTALFYKFYSANCSIICPLAFTFTANDTSPSLLLPLWMRSLVKDEPVLEYKKVSEAEVKEFSGNLKVKYYGNLGPIGVNRLPLEEILPQLFGSKRPLTNGTVLPFIYGGKRFLIQIEAEAIENDEIFWFNLESGSIEIKNSTPKESKYEKYFKILLNGSWSEDFKLLKLQLMTANNLNEEKLIYLITGIPSVLQNKFMELLKIDFELIDISSLIPEEHFVSSSESDEDADQLEFNVNLFGYLGHFDEISTNSTNFLAEILKKCSKYRQTIFTSSSQNSNLELEKLARRHNFQVVSINFGAVGEVERREIMKLRESQMKNNDTEVTNTADVTNDNNTETSTTITGVETNTDATVNLKYSSLTELMRTNSYKKTSTILNADYSVLMERLTVPFYGYKSIKKEFENLIKGPLINPEAYDRFGLPKSSGFLIHGPSGCGKTSLCLNILSTLTDNFTIFHVSTASQLLSKYFGETEANIRKLFAQARERKPAIIFIDQIETLGKKRASNENADSEGTNGASDRYLSTLLNEMDGISGNDGVTLIACANHIENLDDALLRPGRLDRHFHLPIPNDEDRSDLIKQYCPDKEIDQSKFIGLTGAEIKKRLKE